TSAVIEASSGPDAISTMTRIASIGVIVLALTGVLSAQAQQRKLAEFDIPLFGVTATIDPASPVFPKNVAAGVRVVMRSGNQQLSPTDAVRFLGSGVSAKA